MEARQAKPNRETARRAHIIERPRLTRLLDQTQARIIVLVAPAGYGKTTLAREWLVSQRCAWYGATAASADVAAFAVGIANAAAPLLPRASRRVSEWLERYSDPTRRLLYGEVYELGQAALAMTEEEANQVLGHSTGRSVGGLVALAEGWPAVIGLAAFANTPIPSEGSVPEALYDYFAEELYQKANCEIRSQLSVLAAIPSLTSDVTVDVFGTADSELLLREASRLGFVSARQGAAFEMHPLLRAFLLSKFNEAAQAVRDNATRRIFDACIARHAWDDAYAVIAATDSAALVPELVRFALADVLDAGRITTLENWLAFARARRVRSPVLTLARAEIAFRHGWHQKAEAIARQAANQFTPTDAMYGRANLRAGQAAYFNDRHIAALRSFESVRSRSSEGKTKREALWWSFLTGIDLEDPSAIEFLKTYERLHSRGPDDAVRVATGHLSLACRLGRISEALDRARSASYVVNEARDPMVRSSFWNAYVWALTLNSRYDEALEAAGHVLAEARDHDLDFIVPHAALVSAQARLGIRQTLEAGRLLDEVDLAAVERADDFLAVNVRTLRSRMYVVSNKIDEALAVLDEKEKAPQSRATRGERLAVRALGLLLDGRVREALASAHRAHKATTTQATRSLANLVIGMIASESGSRKPRLPGVVSSLSKNGQFDALILAYRARPTLLLNLAAAINENDLLGLISRARDRPLARSEVTVKVHVRHILQKLGVRNRAEAAVLVATQPPAAEGP